MRSWEPGSPLPARVQALLALERPREQGECPPVLARTLARQGV